MFGAGHYRKKNCLEESLEFTPEEGMMVDKLVNDGGIRRDRITLLKFPESKEDEKTSVREDAQNHEATLVHR